MKDEKKGLTYWKRLTGFTRCPKTDEEFRQMVRNMANPAGWSSPQMGLSPAFTEAKKNRHGFSRGMRSAISPTFSPISSPGSPLSDPAMRFNLLVVKEAQMITAVKVADLLTQLGLLVRQHRREIHVTTHPRCTFHIQEGGATMDDFVGIVAQLPLKHFNKAHSDQSRAFVGGAETAQNRVVKSAEDEQMMRTPSISARSANVALLEQRDKQYEKSAALDEQKRLKEELGRLEIHLVITLQHKAKNVMTQLAQENMAWGAIMGGGEELADDCDQQDVSSDESDQQAPSPVGRERPRSGLLEGRKKKKRAGDTPPDKRGKGDKRERVDPKGDASAKKKKVIKIPSSDATACELLDWKQQISGAVEKMRSLVRDGDALESQMCDYELKLGAP